MQLGVWDRQWSCCGETNEDIAGCVVGHHTLVELDAASDPEAFDASDSDEVEEYTTREHRRAPGIFRNGYGLRLGRW